MQARRRCHILQHYFSHYHERNTLFTVVITHLGHADSAMHREREKNSYERNIYSCVNLVHELHSLSKEKRTVADSIVTIKLPYWLDQNINKALDTIQICVT